MENISITNIPGIYHDAEGNLNYDNLISGTLCVNITLLEGPHFGIIATKLLDVGITIKLRGLC